MNQQNDAYGEWIDNWYSEAEVLFERLPSVPPELQGEVQKLLAWKAKTEKAADAYWQARERLWLKRLEREDAEKRIRVIAERQRFAAEMELAERRLRKWQHKLQHLKNEIDRITDQIISEMRRRYERAMLEAALLADVTMQQKTEDDLHVWEAFRSSLEAAASRPPTRKERQRQFKTIEERR
ncbi:MAG TPA: hypothetical protein VJZ27_15610, partial [Aggregatilineales bacterium]|nr:hypothetical protein [Aggregatilineales bacterium]